MNSHLVVTQRTALLKVRRLVGVGAALLLGAYGQGGPGGVAHGCRLDRLQQLLGSLVLQVVRGRMQRLPGCLCARESVGVRVSVSVG